MGLCLNIDCNSGLEFHGEVILENRDLRDQALDQYLVKLRDRGGLAFDEILQVLDQVHLLILDHTVDLGLFSHIPESKNLVSDGVVVSLLVGFLHERLLQFPATLVNDLWRERIYEEGGRVSSILWWEHCKKNFQHGYGGYFDPDDGEWMYSETWFHEDGFEEKSLADIKAYIHETREHGLILGDKYITHDLVPSFYLAD